MTGYFHEYFINLLASITAKILHSGKSFTFMQSGGDVFHTHIYTRENTRPWNWGVRGSDGQPQKPLKFEYKLTGLNMTRQEGVLAGGD